MGDLAYWRLQAVRALYVLSALIVAIILLLPLGGSGRLPGPDIILTLTICWAMRAPHQLPVLLLGVVLLMADFLLMRPPGLLAVLTVLGVEVIRARASTWRELPILAEWAIGGAIIAAILIANALVHSLFLVPQPALGQTLIRLVFSVMIYPVMLALVLFVFRIESPHIKTNAIGARS